MKTILALACAAVALSGCASGLGQSQSSIDSITKLVDKMATSTDCAHDDVVILGAIPSGKLERHCPVGGKATVTKPAS